MYDNEQHNEQVYSDATSSVPEYTMQNITDKEIHMVLLYRMLSTEQQDQIMDIINAI